MGWGRGKPRPLTRPACQPRVPLNCSVPAVLSLPLLLPIPPTLARGWPEDGCLVCHHREPRTSPDAGPGECLWTTDDQRLAVWVSLLLSLLAWSFVTWVFVFQTERVRLVFPCLKLHRIKLKHLPRPHGVERAKFVLEKRRPRARGRREEHTPWTHVATLAPGWWSFPEPEGAACSLAPTSPAEGAGTQGPSNPTGVASSCFGVTAAQMPRKSGLVGGVPRWRWLPFQFVPQTHKPLPGDTVAWTRRCSRVRSGRRWQLRVRGEEDTVSERVRGGRGHTGVGPGPFTAGASPGRSGAPFPPPKGASPAGHGVSVPLGHPYSFIHSAVIYKLTLGSG